MSKSTVQVYNNLFSAIIYVILAMVFCVFAIGTLVFKWALFVACSSLVALFALYCCQKRMATKSSR